MLEKVIPINSGITVNVGVSVKIKKNVVCAKNVIFGILQHIVVKNSKYLTTIIDASVITVMKL